MIAFILTILFFTIVHTIEISFLSTMPFSIHLAPLLYAVVTYLIQHLGIYKIALWLPLHGFILDYYQIGTSSFQIIAYGIAALSIMYLARHVFTNRSFYGVMANALISFLILISIQSIILFTESLLGRKVLWSIFVDELIVGAGFLVLIIILM